MLPSFLKIIPTFFLHGIGITLIFDIFGRFFGSNTTRKRSTVYIDFRSSVKKKKKSLRC